MTYDVILISGEKYFDHPLSGISILKHLLEKYNYSVAVIDIPKNEEEIKKFGKPNLFFGVSSGAIDSMLRNYTPLNKPREEDKYLNYKKELPDRAVLVYCNWIRKNFKDVKIVIGGIEASLRRFTHFDYWENKLRRSILIDSSADILVYGNGEKQILEIASNIKENKPLFGIQGTCIKTTNLPPKFIELPSHEEVLDSKI